MPTIRNAHEDWRRSCILHIRALGYKYDRKRALRMFFPGPAGALSVVWSDVIPTLNLDDPSLATSRAIVREVARVLRDRMWEVRNGQRDGFLGALYDHAELRRIIAGEGYRRQAVRVKQAAE